MKWLPLLLASALPALAQVPPMPPGAELDDPKEKLVSPKYSEHVASLAKSFNVRQVKPLGAAHLITYTPSKVKSFAIPGVKGIVPFAAIQAPLTLAWDYPSDQLTNVYFEVWHSTSLTNGSPLLIAFDTIPADFEFVAFVNIGTTYTIGSPQLPQEYFIVRATDKVTGAHSFWNQP